MQIKVWSKKEAVPSKARLQNFKFVIGHQIFRLEKGKIVERGTHRELVEKKGEYYRLVKDQLELGG